MMRFDPKSKERALEIIMPFLDTKFVLQISQQIVDPKGPRLALGDTEAGKVLINNLAEFAKYKRLAQDQQQLEQAQADKSFSLRSLMSLCLKNSRRKEES